KGQHPSSRLPVKPPDILRRKGEPVFVGQPHLRFLLGKGQVVAGHLQQAPLHPHLRQPGPIGAGPADDNETGNFRQMGKKPLQPSEKDGFFSAKMPFANQGTGLFPDRGKSMRKSEPQAYQTSVSPSSPPPSKCRIHFSPTEGKRTFSAPSRYRKKTAG